MDKTKLGQIQSDDVCVYTVYKPINFWKVGEVKVQPFIIAMIVITGLVIIAVAFFIFKRVKLNRVIQMIEEYSKVDNSDTAKHQQLAEELDGGEDLGSKKGEEDRKKPT